MAVSTEDIKNNYPLPVYNYKVDIAGATVAFSEVSGLNVAYETTTYKESPGDGQTGVQVMHMPAQATTTTLSLKKGLVRRASIATLYNWISATKINLNEKKDITISLCDETGAPVVTWTVSNAFPTKLDVPTFDSNSNDVAIESMELTADGVTMAEA